MGDNKPILGEKMIVLPTAITEPTFEPISLSMAYIHLRLDPSLGSPGGHPEDDLLQLQISAARESAEIYTGLSIAFKSYRLQLSDFPVADRQAIDLNIAPVGEITKFDYVDENGATQSIASTAYQFNENDSTLTPAPNTTWPKTKPGVTNAVTIEFSAGFTDGLSPNPSPCPKSLKAAILLILGHLYQSREATVYKAASELPLGAVHMMTQHRINMGL
jgi:uncharacterized phiE125 gp8 family phage protein